MYLESRVSGEIIHDLKLKPFATENVKVGLRLQFGHVRKVVTLLEGKRISFQRDASRKDGTTDHGQESAAKREPQLVACIAAGRLLQAESTKEMLGSLFIRSNVQAYTIIVRSSPAVVNIQNPQATPTL